MSLSTHAIGIGLLAVFTGITLSTVLPSPLLGIYIILGFGIISLFVGLYQRQKKYFLFTVIASLVLLGTLRSFWMEPVRTSEADASLGKKVELIGTIAHDPDRRTDSVHYTLRVSNISGTTIDRAVYALVSLPRYPEYRVGEEMTLSGLFALPKDFEIDATRPPFPYVKYLAKDGIGYVMRFPVVREVHTTDQFIVMRTLSGWKRAILEKGNTIFPEPEGGLLAGMILGERHALPPDILDQMRIAGLVHIIVVSGYNMTIVAEGVAKLFRFLPLALRASIGLVVIWIYAGMVAGGAPVIRAAIMTSLALFARMTGNTAIALRLLYLSAIAMMIHNPRIVLDDASFHLSFLATLGLIVLSPKILERLSAKGTMGDVPWWKEMFAATVAAQLMVIPYILFFSGQLSPYALPANLLALPVVPLAMLLGTAALLFGAIIPWSALVLGVIASIPAWWVIAVGEWFANMPWSGALFPIPLWGTAVLYFFGWIAVRDWWKRDSVDIAKKKSNNDECKKGDANTVPPEDMETLAKCIPKEHKC